MVTTGQFKLVAIGLTSMLTCAAALGAEIKREEGTLPSQFPYPMNPRFVNHTFATPFNHAFYPETKHPF